MVFLKKYLAFFLSFIKLFTLFYDIVFKKGGNQAGATVAGNSEPALMHRE